jgi:hypothetical protein
LVDKFNKNLGLEFRPGDSSADEPPGFSLFIVYMVEIKRITHRLLLGKIGKTILPIKN